MGTAARGTVTPRPTAARARRSLALWLVAAVVWSAPAPARAGEPSVRDLAAEADAHLDAGRFEAALGVFDRILLRADHPIPRLYKALCLVELGRDLEEAEDLLDGVEGDERLGGLAARIPGLRQRLAELRRPGTLVVTVDGAQAAAAEVVVDGAPVGPAPYEAPLARGAHTVRVQGPGCEAREDPVEVAPATTAALRFRCELAPARLAIETTEDGMSVSINGERRGESPLMAPLELPAGAYTVRLEKHGFLPLQRSVELAPGDLVILDLEPLLAETDRGSSLWAWTTLGTGVALVGVGAGFFIDYAIKVSDAQSPPEGLSPGTVSSEGLIVGGVATGVGAGLIVTSFFLWPGDGDAATARHAPAVAPIPGGASFGWSTTW